MCARTTRNVRISHSTRIMRTAHITNFRTYWLALVLARAGIFTMDNRMLRADNSYKLASKCGVYRKKPPLIKHLHPHWGSVRGGVVVQAIGQRLDDLKCVKLDGRAIPCTLISQEMVKKKPLHRIEFTVPPAVGGNGGAVSVVPVGAEGGEGTSELKFVYVGNGDSFPREVQDAKPRPRSRHGRVFTRLHVVLQTIMNEDGYILWSDFIPKDTIDLTVRRFNVLWTAQTVFRRMHSAGRVQVPRPYTECVYVDDVRKFRNK